MPIGGRGASLSEAFRGTVIQHMGELGGDGKGVVVAIRSRHRAQGWCSCGWIGRRRLLLCSATVDALIHAAKQDCEPATPMARFACVDTLPAAG
jgi:hypothetical protein